MKSRNSRGAILAALLFIAVSTMAGYALQKSKPADHCTPDGGNGSVRCGGEYAQACITLHPDNDEGTGVCQTEDTLPNCCAASPDSADRTAVSCQCCSKAKKAAITIPYDPY